MDVAKLDPDRLWRDYKCQPCDGLRNRLVEIYLPLVNYAANRLYATLPAGVELDDLVSAGVFGLMEAIEAYDLTRGIRFETYAPLRIRGAMLDELRHMDWVPRLARSRGAKIKQAGDALERALGRALEEAEMAYVLGLDGEDFRELCRESDPVGLVSLNKKCCAADSFEDVGQIDILRDPRGDDPRERCDRADELRLLTKGLNRQERLIVIMYYLMGDTMRAIGEALGMSELRVSQLHTQIMARQKEHLTNRAG